MTKEELRGDNGRRVTRENERGSAEPAVRDGQGLPGLYERLYG